MTEAGKGQAPRPGQTKDRSEQGGSDLRGSDRLAQGMDEANERQSGSGAARPAAEGPDLIDFLDDLVPGAARSCAPPRTPRRAR